MCERLKELEVNLQRRFSDRKLYLVIEKDKLVVKRFREDNPKRDWVLLALEKDSSKDYLLKRMYEMDTWENTWAEKEISKDTTEKRIRAYEDNIALRNEPRLVNGQIIV